MSKEGGERGRFFSALKSRLKGSAPSLSPGTDRERLERLTLRAGMQNFYLYDGSPQRDPREMAREYLDGQSARIQRRSG